jgi:hypothetical protein
MKAPRVVILIVLLAAAVCFADGKRDLKQQLVGVWEYRGPDGHPGGYPTSEFTRDGKVITHQEENDKPMTGTYWWVDADTIELRLGSEERTSRLKIAIDGNKLTMIGGDVTVKLTRRK